MSLSLSNDTSLVFSAVEPFVICVDDTDLNMTVGMRMKIYVALEAQVQYSIDLRMLMFNQ